MEAKPSKPEAEANSQGSEPNGHHTEMEAQSGKTYNAIIVEVERFDMKEWTLIPNDSLQSVHTLFSFGNLGSDRLLAIPLDKLQPAAFSNMAYSFADDKPVALEKCLALLQFTKPTNGKQHTSGIRVVGERVRDMTAEGSDKEKYYGTVVLSSFEKGGDFHITEGGTIVLAVINRVSAPTSVSYTHLTLPTICSV